MRKELKNVRTIHKSTNCPVNGGVIKVIFLLSLLAFIGTLWIILSILIVILKGSLQVELTNPLDGKLEKVIYLKIPSTKRVEGD